jgi:hypothetical protein
MLNTQIEEVEIVRARNPVAVDYIKEYLLPDSDFDQEDYCVMIKDMLRETGDKVFFLVLWVGDCKVVGFLIAWLPYLKKHIWLHQAWVDRTFVTYLNGRKAKE